MGAANGAITIGVTAPQTIGVVITGVKMGQMIGVVTIGAKIVQMIGAHAKKRQKKTWKARQKRIHLKMGAGVRPILRIAIRKRRVGEFGRTDFFDSTG
jgi:hypothetical protein